MGYEILLLLLLCMCGAAATCSFVSRRRLKDSRIVIEETLTSLQQGIIIFDHNDEYKFSNEAARSYLPELLCSDYKINGIENFLDYIFTHRTKTYNNGQYERLKEVKCVSPHDYNEIILSQDKFFVVESRHLKSDETIFVLTDVTDLRNSEDNIVELNRQNRELVAAVESTSDGIIICDAKREGRPIVYANQAFCKMSDFSKDDVIGSDWNKLGGHFLKFFEQSDITKIAEAMNYERSCKVDWRVTKNNRHASYQLSISPVFDASNKIDLYVGVQTDISDLKAQEAQFVQAQKLEALGQLAGGVAHDFNNVLSIIDGYARMASKQIQEDREPDLANCIRRIKHASERGAGLTKQLLLFGRHKIVDESVIELAPTIGAQIRLLQPLINSSIDLKVDVDKNLFVDCTSDAFAQILINLVVNARDAMPEGGVIALSARQCCAVNLPGSFTPKKEQNDYVCFTVKDSGMGMDDDLKKRIFDPFFSTKPQGKGTGLGLSMVYGLVCDMGGHIDVKSMLGQGTTINVYLPQSKKRAVKNIIDTTDNAAGIRFDGYTVMVCEDEPDLLALTCAMLSDLGMNVISAANGAEGLVVQDEYDGDIDLLITDVVMPELSGIKLAELMTAVREETQVIFVSGFPSDGKLARSELPEGSIFLAKPVVFEKLVTVIKGVLEHDLASLGDNDVAVWEATGAP